MDIFMNLAVKMKWFDKKNGSSQGAKRIKRYSGIVEVAQHHSSNWKFFNWVPVA